MKIFNWLVISLLITSCAENETPSKVIRTPFVWQDSSIINGFYLNENCTNDTIFNVERKLLTGQFKLKINNNYLTSMSGNFSKDSLLFDDLTTYYNQIFIQRQTDSVWNYYTFGLNNNEYGELYLWRLDSNSVRIEANIVNSI